MEWQPIETAPMDGTKVIIFGGDLGMTCPTSCSAVFEDGEWHLDQWEAPENTVNPTHWMPLPEPPKVG